MKILNYEASHKIYIVQRSSRRMQRLCPSIQSNDPPERRGTRVDNQSLCGRSYVFPIAGRYDGHGYDYEYRNM